VILPTTGLCSACGPLLCSNCDLRPMLSI